MCRLKRWPPKSPYSQEPRAPKSCSIRALIRAPKSCSIQVPDSGPKKSYTIRAPKRWLVDTNVQIETAASKRPWRPWTNIHSQEPRAPKSCSIRAPIRAPKSCSIRVPDSGPEKLFDSGPDSGPEKLFHSVPHSGLEKRLPVIACSFCASVVVTKTFSAKLITLASLSAPAPLRKSH